MQGAVVHLSPGRARVQPGAALPLAALLAGRPAAEAAAMLPRLFNLCRMAQGVAARAALGLAPEVSDADLRAEVLREHLVALCVTLPPLLCRAPGRLPAGDVAGTLFGRGLPKGLNGLAEWLAQGAGCAPLVAALRDALQPGEGVIAPLPLPPAPFAPGLWENSAAARRADHPLLRAVEGTHGRGPLWRLLGRLADAEAVLAGDLPEVRVKNGVAIAPAARGQYALRIDTAGGLVTGLQRRTPTDHLLAPGGALEQALAASRPALAPLIIALHDPCVPVTVKEVAHA
ncbi:MAG: HupK protein [Rhodobacteraceae bacterium]|nr:HupK protein [Paracoccaceae bacterium]